MSVKLFNRVAAAMAAVLVALLCLAADEATDEDEAFFEEILVTAIYRETSELNVRRGKFQANFQPIKSSNEGHRLDAMLNIPVIDDTLALRALAFDTATSGFIERPSTNEFDRNETDIYGAESQRSGFRQRTGRREDCYRKNVV